MDALKAENQRLLDEIDELKTRIQQLEYLNQRQASVICDLSIMAHSTIIKWVPPGGKETESVGTRTAVA